MALIYENFSNNIKSAFLGEVRVKKIIIKRGVPALLKKWPSALPHSAYPWRFLFVNTSLNLMFKLGFVRMKFKIMDGSIQTVTQVPNEKQFFCRLETLLTIASVFHNQHRKLNIRTRFLNCTMK